MISRDLRLARLARSYGANYSWTIVREAKRAGLQLSVALALVEQESGFRNVFGHDAVANTVKGGLVTKERYLEYKRQRKLGRGMQGVGPCQLTWFSYQDEADALGGCWLVRHNIRVGFQLLASLIKRYGLVKGLERYNGTGSAAIRYSADVRRKANRWHDRLT